MGYQMCGTRALIERALPWARRAAAVKGLPCDGVAGWLAASPRKGGNDRRREEMEIGAVCDGRGGLA